MKRTLRDGLGSQDFRIDFLPLIEQTKNIRAGCPKGNCTMDCGATHQWSGRPPGPASSRVQGKHSHPPPRERPPQQRQTIRQQLRETPWNRTRNQTLRHTISPTTCFAMLMRSQNSSSESADRRKVYYLAECTKLPAFRLGSVLCARRSVRLSWIARHKSRVGVELGEVQCRRL
jgi:hypothetical protein